MKKITILLAILAAGSLMAQRVQHTYDFSAQSPDGSQLFYRIVDTAARVTYPGINRWHAWDDYAKPSGELIIPDTVWYEDRAYPVTSIDSFTFDGSQDLTSVVLPGTMREIMYQAFNNDTNLVSIQLPPSLTVIGQEAFQNLRHLRSIDLPTSLTTIGYSAFFCCYSLTSVIVPEQVDTIMPWAFGRCTGLTDITIRGNLRGIGYSAFQSDANLARITLRAAEPPEYYFTAFAYVDTDNVVVSVPCGSGEAYAERWYSFSHFVEELPLDYIARSADSLEGRVEVMAEPTCDNPVLTVRAEPVAGYRFIGWSDGSTDNPHQIDLWQDTLIVATFAADVRVREAAQTAADIIAQPGAVVVRGAQHQRIAVYDVMGRLAAHSPQAGPEERLALPAPGIYLVRIGSETTKKVAVL